MIAFRSVQGSHGDGSLRCQSALHTQTEVLIQMALAEHSFCVQIIRAEQETAHIRRTDRRQQTRQIMAGRAIAQHDIHAVRNTGKCFLCRCAFMIRCDSHRRIRIETAAGKTRRVPVDEPARLLRHRQLVHGLRLCLQHARIVHEFSQSQHILPLHRILHVLCQQNRPRMVKTCRRNAGRQHELDIQHRFFRSCHHVIQTSEPAYIDDFMRIGDDGRSSARNHQSPELLRTQIRGFYMDMTVNKARCRIAAPCINHLCRLIRAAGTGDPAIRKNNIALADRLIIHIYDPTIFQHRIPRQSPLRHRGQFFQCFSILHPAFLLRYRSTE